MIIKTIAIGNTSEGYVETDLTEAFNIISSNENNKGKTIVLQGLMYALGNVPVFPASFNYEDYYYIVEFVVNDTTYWICRKSDEFIVLCNGSLHLFEGVSELKRYWNKNIFTLPSIIKNNMQRIVDPELFLQLFFVGQDKKDSSNIVNKGFYNKVDFLNMLYSYYGINAVVMDETEIENAKRELAILKESRAALVKQHKILKSKKKSATYLSSINDRAAFEQTIKSMEAVQNKIAELKKARNQYATRKSKWETTIKELRSLNRSIQTGELRCMDCDSTNIIYKGVKKDSFSFEVSNSSMRKQIIESIQEKINDYQEEMEKCSEQINKQQEILQNLMAEEDISLETIVAYKSEMMDASEAERQIAEIDARIGVLKNSIEISESGLENQKEEQRALITAITSAMYAFYKEVDAEGNLTFNDIFTKHGVVYSGSDATMFFLAKMYAFATILKHNFPIIIDSFRAEDLSTTKEHIVKKKFADLGNQLIFTTTLKAEEQGKYEEVEFVHNIDYSGHASSHIMDEQCGDKIVALLNMFAL